MYTDISNQACTIIGSEPGSAIVSGSAYILAKYGIKSGDIWRDVGIMWAMYASYSLLVMLGASLLVRDTGLSSTKLFARRSAINQESASASVASKEINGARQNQHEVANTSAKDFANAPVFTYQVSGSF